MSIYVKILDISNEKELEFDSAVEAYKYVSDEEEKNPDFIYDFTGVSIINYTIDQDDVKGLDDENLSNLSDLEELLDNLDENFVGAYVAAYGPTDVNELFNLSESDYNFIPSVKNEMDLWYDLIEYVYLDGFNLPPIILNNLDIEGVVKDYLIDVDGDITDYGFIESR